MIRLSIVAALAAVALIAASGTASAIGPDSGNGTSPNGIRTNGSDLFSRGATGVSVIAVELPARIDR